MKRTFQPSKLIRKRRHGFLNRSIAVLLNRRRKGRKTLSA